MFHNKPFSATNHRGVLIPKMSSIDLQYAKYIMEPIFRGMKKGREGSNGQNEYTSLPPFMISHATINLPVDNDGNPNLIAQREIARRYEVVVQLKETIRKKRDEIANSIVLLDNDSYCVRTISLTDDTLFEFVHGTLSSSKKKLSVLNTGHDDDIPVFTAGKPPIAYIKQIEQKPPVDCSSLSPVISFASNGDGSAGRNFIIHDRPFIFALIGLALEL